MITKTFFSVRPDIEVPALLLNGEWDEAPAQEFVQTPAGVMICKHCDRYGNRVGVVVHDPDTKPKAPYTAVIFDSEKDITHEEDCWTDGQVRTCVKWHFIDAAEDKAKAATFYETLFPPFTLYVSLYLVDRSYGGAEEGGWWYPCGEPDEETVKTFMSTDRASAEAYAHELETERDERNAHRHSDISSVLSEGRFEVVIEEDKPAPFPRTRPHYE